MDELESDLAACKAVIEPILQDLRVELSRVQWSFLHGDRLDVFIPPDSPLGRAKHFPLSREVINGLVARKPTFIEAVRDGFRELLSR